MRFYAAISMPYELATQVDIVALFAATKEVFAKAANN
jgi:hypothetical protein